MIPAPVSPIPPPTDTARDARLRDAAVRLEAGFLKEMMAAAGLGRTPDAFGGGAGEDQFASFLLEEQAHRLARAGGVGLAESLFQALKARDDR
jgi:Rod binding domain-containing protein